MMFQESGKLVHLILILKLSLNTLGFFARDMTTKKQILNATTVYNGSVIRVETYLERYDINASYYITGLG